MKRDFSFFLLILTFIPCMGTESSLTIFVDVSGSVAGLSSNRRYSSIEKIKSELNEFIPLYLSLNDELRVVSFTDTIITDQTLYKDQLDLLPKITSRIYPVKGNSNIKYALDNIKDKVNIIITDGLYNTISPKYHYDKYLDSILAKENPKVYMLLLDSRDDNITVTKFKENNRLLVSLKDIDVNSELKKAENQSTFSDEIVPVKEKSIQVMDSDNPSTSFNWINVLWLILALIIIIVLGYFICHAMPLVFNTSAAAMQQSIGWLYQLPKPLYKMVKVLSSPKMKKFLDTYIGDYDGIARGEYVPNTPQQEKAVEEFKKITGKYPKYKDGEIDLSPVAKYEVELDGGLDNNIPRGKDVRANVHFAQDKAAEQMLNSPKGRKIIADYHNIPIDDVKYEYYTDWKDDALNRGKPNFNPLTPHETVDGCKILYVPKRFHDVAWGGISHKGGVARLRDIRTFFEL